MMSSSGSLQTGPSFCSGCRGRGVSHHPKGLNSSVGSVAFAGQVSTRTKLASKQVLSAPPSHRSQNPGLELDLYGDELPSIVKEVHDLSTAILVHSCILKKGFSIDAYLGTLLIGMYVRCGAMADACAVFYQMRYRNLISWNAIISAHSKNGHEQQAFQIFQEMKQHSMKPNDITFISILSACTDVVQGKMIHDDINDSEFASYLVVGNALINMYGRCGCTHDAFTVFHAMHEHDVVSWNSMIAACCKNGDPKKALELLGQMQQQGVKPDKVTFTSTIGACTDLVLLEQGKMIHGSIVKGGFESDVPLSNALINMYGTCGAFEEAQAVFDTMFEHTVVSYTSLITLYSQYGFYREAFQMFNQMQQHGVRPNEFTLASMLGACAIPGALEKGKAIHMYIVENGMESDVVIGSALINMYSNCESLSDAHTVFDNMQLHNLAAWTAMIEAFSLHGCGKEALALFRQMQKQRLQPDYITFISLLGTCTNSDALADGKEIHACIVNSGCLLDVSLKNALITMYGRCGAVDQAHSLFDDLHDRDVVSWTAMITAYIQCHLAEEALQLFLQMQHQGIKPNEATFVSILGACEIPAALVEGRAIHACIVEHGMISDIIIGSALIMMYGRCGTLLAAWVVFLKMQYHNVVSWNAMMSTYYQHGRSWDVVWLFRKMQQHLVEPNEVTYVCLLCSCSRAGLVNEGQGFFNSMIEEHAITPRLEHYNCMVDLYGRAGKMVEAEKVIFTMPLQPDAQVWMTLLSACKMHEDVERAEMAAKNLLKLDPGNATASVLLSNLYAANGR